MNEPKNQLPSAPSPAGETASEEVTEEMDAYGIPEERQCVCFGTAGCEVCGGSGDLADAKSVPEPVSTEEALKIRKMQGRLVSLDSICLCQKNLCPIHSTRQPAAPIAPAAVSDNRRGFELWLSREQWGFVSDGLIEHAATLRKRKGINPESTADETVQQVEAVIQIIGDACPIKYAKPSAEGDGWIAVTERLPDLDVDVLTYSKHDWGIHIGRQEVNMGNRRIWCEHRIPAPRELPYVTHWRLLPAPPSGQGEVK